MDNTALMLFFATLPVILILVVVYNSDKSKEPLPLLMELFVFGILSCFLVVVISNALEFIFPFIAKETKSMNFIEIILYAFLAVALVEELCKWLVVYIIGYHNKEFDELYDIIVYAVFVSLGFAFMENVIYIFYLGDLSTAIIRAVSAIPGHACDAIFMGYYLSLAKEYHYQNRRDLEIKNIIMSIIMPTIIHGIYDYCLMSGLTILIGVFISFVIALYFISINKLRNVAQNNKNLLNKNVFCPICGAHLNDSICPNCNQRQD